MYHYIHNEFSLTSTQDTLHAINVRQGLVSLICETLFGDSYS